MALSPIISTGYALFLLLAAVQLLFTTIRAEEKPQLEEKSWAKLQVSSDTLGSMPYKNYRINIYEHSRNPYVTANRKKYFYAPIALLDNRNMTSRRNVITRKTELRFRIEMWNDKVNQEIADFLKNHVDNQTKPHQVQIIPFDRVRLTTNFPSSTYKLNHDWITYQLQKTLTFALLCETNTECAELKSSIETDPTHIEHIKLSFRMSSELSQTKELTVTTKSVSSGKMANELIQRIGSAKNEVLLTDADEKELFSEMTSNIIMESFDDSDLISTRSETYIRNFLQEMLGFSNVTISKQNEKMWESVFWDDEKYRPDKSTKMLNEIYQKLDNQNKQKMIEAFNDNKNESTKVFYSIISNGVEENSSEENVLTEDFQKLYDESKNYVEWSGQAFIPKSLNLSKINLGNLLGTQSFKDRSVNIRYERADLSTPIHFVQSAEYGVDDELDKLHGNIAKLEKQLKGTRIFYFSFFFSKVRFLEASKCLTKAGCTRY